MSIEWSGCSSHGKRFTPALFASALREKAAELLPGGLGFRFILKCHNRDVVVRTTLGADATADAAFGYIDLATGKACNASTATQHADRVLTLAAGGGDTDVANDHALAVHARMPMASGTGLLTLVAVDALVKVNDEHFRPFDHATSDQRTQTSAGLSIRERINNSFSVCMCKRIEDACLSGGCRIVVLLETHGKALVDLGIACDEG